MPGLSKNIAVRMGFLHNVYSPPCGGFCPCRADIFRASGRVVHRRARRARTHVIDPGTPVVA
jgi:hypothetical protein